MTEPTTSALNLLLLALAALIVVALCGSAQAQEPSDKPIPPRDRFIGLSERISKLKVVEPPRDVKVPTFDSNRPRLVAPFEDELKAAPDAPKYPLIDMRFKAEEPKGMWAQGWDVIKQAWAWALAFPIAAVLLFIAIAGALEKR